MGVPWFERSQVVGFQHVLTAGALRPLRLARGVSTALLPVAEPSLGGRAALRAHHGGRQQRAESAESSGSSAAVVELLGAW